MLSAFTLIAFFSIAHAESQSNLSPNLKKFLGPEPKGFATRFLEPAKMLRHAVELKRGGKQAQAINELQNIANRGDIAEHAVYELAMLYRDAHDLTKSSAQFVRLLSQFPPSPYIDSAREMILENNCDMALSDSVVKSGSKKRKEALLLCLQKTPWKDWTSHEDQIGALFDVLKATKDPLLGPLVGEALLVLPNTSPLRSKFSKELRAKDLEIYTTLPRYRSRLGTPAGIKPVNEDSDEFDHAVVLLLTEKFRDAYDLLKKFLVEYPQSEHTERAEFWLAKCEDKIGKPTESRTRFTRIMNQSPLSYYGLQSALALNKDLSAYVAPQERTIVKFTGTPTTKQAMSLWRIRAFLEVGLLDHARDEAGFLAQVKPGGSGIGQDSAEGASLMALLFHEADYHLAAFAHSVAAISLDPDMLNGTTLEMLFPPLYEKEFALVSEQTSIHPLLLQSLTKQESAFLPNALSRADALGLMQLLYSTAKEVQPSVSKRALFNPEENISIGSRYLGKMLEKYQGNVALALSAYNAGPNRATAWQKKFLETVKTDFPVDLFIETIPFTETRKYVSAILRNYYFYRLLHKENPAPTIQELAFEWQKKKPQELKPEESIATPQPADTNSPPASNLPSPQSTPIVMPSNSPLPTVTSTGKP